MTHDKPQSRLTLMKQRVGGKNTVTQNFIFKYLFNKINGTLAVCIYEYKIHLSTDIHNKTNR